MSIYGKPPERVGEYVLDQWHEFMHYMYLPVMMPGHPGLRLPANLGFAYDLVEDCVAAENGRYAYVYVTARRGYATPGNPLNRPGWHADGFGTDDVNYVWTDRFPTDYALQTFRNISDQHGTSMQQFEDQIKRSNIFRYPENELLRLDPYVIHSAPAIPAPGGVRSFFKVSFSNSRYNLAGNSHNYLFQYDWTMHERQTVRNDPARKNADAVHTA